MEYEGKLRSENVMSISDGRNNDRQRRGISVE